MNKQICTFYVVRHGETAWNEKGVVQGHTDIALSSKGEKQAQEHAKTFATIPFSKVLSSDLQRAKRTAEILIDGRKLPIEIHPGLRERSWGQWEGTEFDMLRVKFGNEFNSYTGDAPHNVPGVESSSQLLRRVTSCLHDYGQKFRGHSILVVTHGGVLRDLISHLSVTHLEKSHFDNLGFIQLAYDGEIFSFIGASGVYTRLQQ